MSTPHYSGEHQCLSMMHGQRDSGDEHQHPTQHNPPPASTARCVAWTVHA
ncbi:MAG: hypothetical protein GY938_00565 [Ketobacter sp.]|nr:hypothetical protein [Ketobacter sp.]